MSSKRMAAIDADREQILSKIRSCQPELKKLGVRRLAIFGSVARGKAHPGSAWMSWWSSMAHRPSMLYMEIRFLLEDVLSIPVDLVTLDGWDNFEKDGIPELAGKGQEFHIAAGGGGMDNVF